MGSSQLIGEDTLKFMAILKQEKPGSGTIASGANDLQKAIRALGRLAEVSHYMEGSQLPVQMGVHCNTSQ